MPTLSNSHLPKPKSWDEFEDITLDALRFRWNSPDLTRHGRQGQKQDGVDIYGMDSFGQQIGVQCKNTISKITPQLIDSEISNAEQFQPSLSALYIATSMDSCVTLQQYVRNLSVSRCQAQKFGVKILFWNDISQDLTLNPQLVAKHYPQLNLTTSQPIILDDRTKDIRQMKDILSYVDLEGIQYDTSKAPKIVNLHFMEVVDVLVKIRKNPIFVLFDDDLRKTLDSFLMKWEEISYTGQYCYDYHGHDQIIFPTPGDFFRSHEEQKTFEKLGVLYSELRSELTTFISFIMNNYPEIDIQETNGIARKRYHEMQKDLNAWAAKNNIL